MSIRTEFGFHPGATRLRDFDGITESKPKRRPSVLVITQDEEAWLDFVNNNRFGEITFVGYVPVLPEKIRVFSPIPHLQDEHHTEALRLKSTVVALTGQDVALVGYGPTSTILHFQEAADSHHREVRQVRFFSGEIESFLSEEKSLYDDIFTDENPEEDLARELHLRLGSGGKIRDLKNKGHKFS